MLNPLLTTGISIVTVALILYTIAYYFESRYRLLSAKVLVFFAAGLFFDITATVLMFLGSGHIPITPHGIIGYTALTAMMVNIILLMHQKKGKGLNSKIPKKLYIYSTVVYFWWVLTFLAGGLLAMVKKSVN